MPEVVDIRCSDDPRDIVHRSSQHLAEGSLVLLPTETQYTLVGSGLQAEAVNQIRELAGKAPLELVVRSAEDARDYWSDPPAVMMRLSRRAWPGPVVVSVSESLLGGLFAQLPAATQSQLASRHVVRFRSPAHPLWNDLQRYVPGPLVCVADGDGVEFLRQATAEVPPAWNDAAALVVEDGPCRYGDATTVVRVDQGQWAVETEGVVGAGHVGRLVGEVILFVCTGNTCRSPMAEALFRKALADRLKCDPAELEDRGYVVLSGGLAAGMGAPASPEAVELLAADGIDLSGHASQPVTNRLLKQADAIYAMTRQHRQTILAGHPELESRVQLLAQDKSDIPDPIGGGPDAYEEAKREIERHVRTIVERLKLQEPAKPAP